MSAEELDTQADARKFRATVVLILTAMACAILLLAMPRAIVPRELPPLVLDAERMAKALAAEAKLAQQAPGGIDVDDLQTRLIAEGLAERAPPEEMAKATARRHEMQAAAKRVFARVGPEGVSALRAAGVEHFWRAFRGEIADERERDGWLGTFPELLRTYGLIDEQGAIRAPELSVHAMAKARWSLIHGLEPDAGLTAIEVQAFEGFIALHAGAAPSERRASAARAFHEAGGHRGAQAYATWLFHGGRVKEARALMENAYERRRELSTRNFLLGLALPAL